MRLCIWLFLIVSGCAHYQPLQFIGGTQRTEKVVLSSCSPLVFSFPMSREKVTIAEATSELGVLQKEIYSIDRSTWPYLFNLFGENCLRFNMNAAFDFAKYKQNKERAELLALENIKNKKMNEDSDTKKQIEDQRKQEDQIIADSKVALDYVPTAAEVRLQDEKILLEEANLGAMSGNRSKDIDACNVLEGTKRLDCMRLVNKHYKIKKK